MPTVLALAWMKQAVEEQFGKTALMQDYRLLKGIVFDGTEPSHCLVDLQAQEQVVTVKISSINAAQKPVFHYAAEFVLGQASAVVAKKLLQGDAKDAAYLYQNGSLFHGDSLQGIKQVVRCDEQGLQLHCVITAKAAQQKGLTSLEQSNVFANDLVYQAMLVWVREQMGLGSLPSATAQWAFYREVALDEPFDLLLEVTEQSQSQCIAEVQLIDANGLVIADVKGVKVTASASLNHVFKQEGKQ